MLAGCVDGNRAAESSPGSTTSPTLNVSASLVPLVASSPGVEPPVPCGVERMGRRLAMLIEAVNRRDGKALARSFQFGPDLRWETHRHFDPPNGTAGALRSRVVIDAFADELAAGHEVRTNGALVSPRWKRGPSRGGRVRPVLHGDERQWAGHGRGSKSSDRLPYGTHHTHGRAELNLTRIAGRKGAATRREPSFSSLTPRRSRPLEDASPARPAGRDRPRAATLGAGTA